jgi:glycosyltransferase involved in cell wall biosynthesis
MNLTVAVIARNAQDSLSGCLESISGLTDDIVVVVDHRTSDNTARIARHFHARTEVNQFTDFSSQRNFAASRAKYDWILFLDADEQASPGLVATIKDLPERPLFKAYDIPRLNKIFGKYIRHTNWDPNGIVRLYNRHYTRWQGKIHEQIVQPDILGHIYDPIYHDNYRSVEEFISRQDYYSTLRAESLFTVKTHFSLFNLFWQAKYDFLRRYVWHLGILDGWHGLFLSYLMVIYHLSVWIKLWHKYQKS